MLVRDLIEILIKDVPGGDYEIWIDPDNVNMKWADSSWGYNEKKKRFYIWPETTGLVDETPNEEDEE